jgi:hypothetical protein
VASDAASATSVASATFAMIFIPDSKKLELARRWRVECYNVDIILDAMRRR